MSAEKKYTERELILARRAAWMQGQAESTEIWAAGVSGSPEDGV